VVAVIRKADMQFHLIISVVNKGSLLKGAPIEVGVSDLQ
jgi:hypothetical protein